MAVTLKSCNRSNYFNVLLPDSQDKAIYNGLIKDNQYRSKLSSSGENTIRIYMMRNAAQSNEFANFKLEILRE